MTFQLRGSFCRRVLCSRSHYYLQQQQQQPSFFYYQSTSQPNLFCCWRSFSSTTATTATASTTTTTTTRSRDSPDEVQHTDVLIVGGGVVGCSIARQILVKAPNLVVGLVEAKLPPARSTTTDGDDDDDAQQQQQQPPHPRSYALSPYSLNWLGLQQEEEEEEEQQESNNNNNNTKKKNRRLGYYSSMQVWEAKNPASIVFTANDVIHPASPWLGAVVEESTIVQHLWDQIYTSMDNNNEQQQQLRLFTNASLTHLKLPKQQQQQQHDHKDQCVQVQLESNQTNHHNNHRPTTPSLKTTTTTTAATTTIHTKLIIGADGGNSMVRRLAGIPRNMIVEYNQHALTFTVRLARGNSHRKRAFQRFLPSGGGPMALLPTFSPDHAIVVWSTSLDSVQEWKSQPQQRILVQHINDMLQEGPQLPDLFFPKPEEHFPWPLSNVVYGAEQLIQLAQYGPALWAQQESAAGSGGSSFVAPPLVESIVSPLFSFPLSCSQVASYTAANGRLALAGDAAHSVHPMAGQGLNLGLHDAVNLLDCIQRAHDAGMDISLFLNEYETARQVQGSATLAGVHALQRLFVNGGSGGGGGALTLLQHAKSVGMNVIQNVTPLRKQLAQAACNGVTLPNIL